MAQQGFSRSAWVFDLDNTLYSPRCNLWPQVQELITAYVISVTGLPRADALALQKRYRDEFGTTLNGLMRRHGVDPDHFLQTVHAIDYTPVSADPVLIAAITALPGEKFILTNGDIGHARSVLARLGGERLFPHIFDIRAMRFTPKPHKDAYAAFLAAHAVDPRRAVMFDDLEHNLRVPHELGMLTVQVIDGARASAKAPHYIDHRTADLASFLRTLQ